MNGLFKGLRSRSKSSARRPDSLAAPSPSSSRPHSRASSKHRHSSSLTDDERDDADDEQRGRSYIKTTSDGIPIVQEHRRTRRVSSYHPQPQPPPQHYKQHSSSSSSSSHSRSNSRQLHLLPVAKNSRGVYFVDPRYPNPMSAVVPHHHQPGATQTMYHVPTTAPYFGAHGQVVYPPGVAHSHSHYDSSASPQSHHLDSAAHRGRSRHASTARDKILISAGAAAAAPVPVALPLGPPSSHESSHSSSRGSSGIFGSWVQSIRARSRSKSRDRDALYPGAGGAPSSSSSSDHHHHHHHHPHKSSRHYDPVQDELARRMEKDLRLQDMEDPYRPVRRERSRSFDASEQQQQRARDRAARRNADLDPEVVLNTRYNAQNLKYHSPTDAPRPHPISRHTHTSGYATDVQPVMLRRSSTSTNVMGGGGVPTRHSSSASSRPNPAAVADMQPLKGWFNRRGDQFIDRNTVICQPLDRQFSSRFKGYPEVGQGFGDSNGNIIDANGKLVKRIG